MLFIFLPNVKEEVANQLDLIKMFDSNFTHFDI